jgi:uncharacterized phiE125 gp8 family phage protein
MTLIHTPSFGVNSGLRVSYSLPATPLITTADAKKFMRIDASFTADDDEVDSLVASATYEAQQYFNRALITQTITAEWNTVARATPLPFAPVQSIASVTTIGADGTETVLTSSDYKFINGEIRINTSLGLRVVYVAGYGDASTDVPTDIIKAVNQIALDNYEHRESQVVGDNIDQMVNEPFRKLDRYINYAGG